MLTDAELDALVTLVERAARRRRVLPGYPLPPRPMSVTEADAYLAEELLPFSTQARIRIRRQGNALPPRSWPACHCHDAGRCRDGRSPRAALRRIGSVEPEA
jgi:hypothetical protein